MRLGAALALLLLTSSPLLGAAPPTGKVHHTYPQPPIPRPADPMHITPGVQIPEHPEYYTWRITNKLAGGKAVYQEAVPLYRIKYLERTTRKGEIAVGTTVILDHVARLGRVLYYQVPAPDADPGKVPTDPDDMAWVNGMFIEPVAYQPPAGR